MQVQRRTHPTASVGPQNLTCLDSAEGAKCITRIPDAGQLTNLPVGQYILMCYANWCSICHQSAPVFLSIAQRCKTSRQNIQFLRVLDRTEAGASNTSKINEFLKGPIVTGYPTFLFLNVTLDQMTGKKKLFYHRYQSSLIMSQNPEAEFLCSVDTFFKNNQANLGDYEKCFIPTKFF